MGALDNRVAIVTGAASGIGAATVRAFASAGAAVVCTDINEEKGKAVVADITASGGQAIFQRVDVTQLDQLEASVALAVDRFGGLDIMHNNAAASGGAHVANIDAETWRHSLDIMLNGVFYGIKAAIPAMLERGRGSIISTASVEGFFGEMMAAPYCTAKAGVINLSRTAAIEYGRRNIRVNCICPGVVDTPMFDLLQSVSPHSRETVAAQHALGRILRPEEIANVAVFLASEQSSGITGAAIVVDGGLTAGLNLTGFPPA
jgi:NAD(P)-dependent dehydrogenase (short-subunit alcohol dehydrogenase family)